MVKSRSMGLSHLSGRLTNAPVLVGDASNGSAAPRRPYEGRRQQDVDRGARKLTGSRGRFENGSAFEDRKYSMPGGQEKNGPGDIAGK